MKKIQQEEKKKLEKESNTLKKIYNLWENIWFQRNYMSHQSLHLRKEDNSS